jgi:hypothetical protein
VLGDLFIARRLEPARISFEQQYGNRGVPFVLYEMPANTSPAPGGREDAATYAATADLAPAGLNPDRAVESPISLEGRLAFLGADTYRDGEMLDVETWWRVTNGSIARPFAVMGHLLTSQGQVIGQWDGLGVSPLALDIGDILVQRHRFPAPSAGSASGETWLRTGVYWADDLQRWAVDNGQSSRTSPADVLLTRLEIE